MADGKETEFDFVVVGGGIPGVCAALAAARHGLKTALVEREVVLGGDSSSLRRRPILGADVWGMRPHGRETGILEELRLDYFGRHSQPDWRAWDALLEATLRREENVTLFLNASLDSVEKGDDDRITSLHLIAGEARLRLSAPVFADCTGDGDLGRRAGADLRTDAESRDEFEESLAPEEKGDLRVGVRLMGDAILTENDLRNGTIFEDEVAYGGWPLTDGYDWNEAMQEAHPELWLPRMYGIPLRSLYSRNVPNLLIAGSIASATAVARRSTSVMGTGATMGQAVGTCAALCRKYAITPREVAQDRIWELQQTLLKDDAALPNRLSEDPYDLARFSRAVATSKLEADTIPSNVINGLTRASEDWPQMWASNPKVGFPTNIEIDFVERRVVDTVYLTFDTGLCRPLALTDDESRRRKMVEGPQPETVKSYTVLAGLTTRWNPIVEVSDNVQRRRVHHFEAVRVNRMRIVVNETHGVDHARIYEVRCYREEQ